MNPIARPLVESILPATSTQMLIRWKGLLLTLINKHLLHVFLQLPVCLLLHWMRGTSWWASTLSCVVVWIQVVGLSGKTFSQLIKGILYKLSKYVTFVHPHVMSPCEDVRSWNSVAVLWEKLVSASSGMESLRTHLSAAGWAKSWWDRCVVYTVYC